MLSSICVWTSIVIETVTRKSQPVTTDVTAQVWYRQRGMTFSENPLFGMILGSPRRGVRGHIRVLVVDDSSIVRRFLVGRLAEMTGIKVVGEALSAAEAILLVTRLQPNVVILDLEMPGGSGLEVLTHVKTSALGVTVIMFSAFRDEHVPKQCKQMGADHCFVKPEGITALLGVLAQLAQRMGWEQPKVK